MLGNLKLLGKPLTFLIISSYAYKSINKIAYVVDLIGMVEKKKKGRK